MRRINGFLLFAVKAFCLLPLLTASAAVAGVVGPVVALDFGEIDVNPGGDVIVIDAHNGPAIPTATHSCVFGGGSGSITLTSSDVEQVDVSYPETVILRSGGNSIVISNSSALSQKYIELPGGGVSKKLNIGGSLSLEGGVQQGSYSGTMTIELNFY